MSQVADDAAFTRLVAVHRRELLVHCYRMLGSFEDAEELVQETFLRAWRGAAGFQGRSTVRAWLYRIATNACLDVLDGRRRRVLPDDPDTAAPPGTDIAWLQPFPDRLWAQPEAAAVARETVELAFLAAIQHLPPRQRAALIVRDVLGWSAKETAALLDSTVVSVNSALQRARETLKEHLPAHRLDWAPAAAPTDAQRAVLRRYMDAVEGADLNAVAALLAEDVRATMPPFPEWFQGRDAVLGALAASWDPAAPGYVGRFRMLPTRANGQLAAAAYVRAADDGAYRPFALGVLRVEAGLVVEVTAFHEPGLFPAFDLPAALPG